MKPWLLVLAVCLQLLAHSVRAATDVDVLGLYENRSESSFIFTLKLEKMGRATYSEPDLEGGKPFVMLGRWTLAGDVIALEFPKGERYTYVVRDKLSWESFGCKGASFGLEVQAIPKVGATKDSSFHLWRAADRSRLERCHTR